jgi:signal peptidase I
MRPDPRSRPRRPLATTRLVVDLVLLGVLLVGCTGVVLGRVLPALGYPVLVVAGPSMVPAIGVGAAAVLESVPADALRVGDVVSLRSGPERAIFTHRIGRIVERDGEVWLETKGDANADPDPSITPASAVIGRVAVTLPAAGYLLTVVSAPTGVMFILSTGVLFLVLGWWLDGIAYEQRRRGTLDAPAPTSARSRHATHRAATRAAAAHPKTQALAAAPLAGILAQPLPSTLPYGFAGTALTASGSFVVARAAARFAPSPPATRTPLSEPVVTSVSEPAVATVVEPTVEPAVEPAIEAEAPAPRRAGGRATKPRPARSKQTSPRARAPRRAPAGQA